MPWAPGRLGGVALVVHLVYLAAVCCPSEADSKVTLPAVELALREPLQAVPLAESAVRLPHDFKRLGEFGAGGAPVAIHAPVQRGSIRWLFPLIKIPIIVVVVFLWIRGIRLCAFDDEDDVSRPSWIAKLFWIGLAGILLGLILPAYAPAAVLLVAASAVPYWQYMRWRNRQPFAANEPLVWNQFFSTPLHRQNRIEFTVESDLFANHGISTTNSTIRLIGKSPLALSSTSGFSRGAQGSQSFQRSLALIDHAANCRATDLHINTKSNRVEIRQRIDGTLVLLGDLPLPLGRAMINVFKVMSDLNIADRRRSQDGSFIADVNDRRLSFRVSSQGTQTGELLSIRILDPSKTFSDLSSLGMSSRIRTRFNANLQRSHGLILIVGTTGAGKSTTACAALQTIDWNTRNIVSIEDPIEYQIPNVDQIEVNSRGGQTFQSVLRSVLRLDADVIFIGEIRDEETAKVACQAAQTGQLVLATMHANDSVAAALRLAELAQDLQAVTTTLRAVLAQTLVRKLCLACRSAYTPDPQVLSENQLAAVEGPLYRSPELATAACTHCDNRGFLRRTGIYELTELSPKIYELIHQRAPATTIASAARDNGMTSLRDEGLRLVREGTISLEEFHRVLGPL